MTGASDVGPLRVVRDGHIEVWTMALPEQRNPITGPDMVTAMVAAVDAAERDPEVRCVVLTGEGPAFSAGGNIKEIRAGLGYFGAAPFEAAQGYRDGIQRLARAVQGLELPIVAAVNGPAVGAGCDLAMMCDLRVASTRASFAESFVKLGLIPGDGGAWLLRRAVGPARAAEMTLTGDAVDAAQALEWGLVSEVCEPDELLDRALSLANRIAVNPPRAVRTAKRLLRDAEHQRFGDALTVAGAAQAIAHQNSEHREAVGRRSPDEVRTS
ncbi:crotonase/enoyl-CoA hydratase family protein [Nocardioides sp. NPDC051685]|uniref:crotonase/enoyl-CoA hydratase family protein n=1 Tax=Nocardioides sp. NPDC051685 TaxID=3364334 RepID=UPI0037B1AFC2